MTVSEYLPALRRIFAALEVGFAHDPNPTKLNDMRLLFLENELPGSTYVHAMDILEFWLRDTKFKADFARIWRRDPSTDWRELMVILREKLTDFENEAPLIVLGLSERTGLLTREIHGEILKCPFESDSMKLQILIALRSGEHIPPAELLRLTGSTSSDSVSATIKNICDAARVKLQLPKNKRLIEHERAGYRLNPIYNLVVTK